VKLESKYFDTAAHDLLGSRLTLRRRMGSTDEGWHLKVPAGDARTEIRLPVDGATAPKELQQLTFGVRRGAALRPVAIVRTHRDVRLLTDASGRALAEVVLDDVTAEAVGSSVTITTWREVEVELKDGGDEALLRKIASRLRKNGAVKSSSTSKLARALGEAPPAPVRPGKTVLGAVMRYLDEQYTAIVAGDLALRRGHDVIHKTRVATRRYRSVLRVFGSLFDAERAAALDAELKWYAAALGDVRDLQVLRGHLFADLAELPPELVLGPVSARLSETFGTQIAQAQRKLDTAMRSKRYVALLDELRAWSLEPPVRQADAPAAKLSRYLGKAQKKYAKRLRAAEKMAEGEPGKNEAMHRARKAAKRARYAAELSAPTLGKPARKYVEHAKNEQDRLGARQDAIVAVDFLRRVGAAAGTTPGENGFTFGILLGRELRRGSVSQL
jgi:CHAD domain-containing protein